MKKQATDYIKLKLHTAFDFAHFANATNTAMALAQSGYFINIIKESDRFTVYVYKR